MREELKALHAEIGKICRDAYGIIDIQSISLYLEYIKSDLNPIDRYWMYSHLVYDARADIRNVELYRDMDQMMKIPKNIASNNQTLQNSCQNP